VTSGSNPVGSQLCSWSTSTSSHSYTITIYATNPSSVLTAAFKTEICSSTVESSIKAGLP
jgi:DNA gyrase inhibitor GyrI